MKDSIFYSWIPVLAYSVLFIAICIHLFDQLKQYNAGKKEILIFPIRQGTPFYAPLWQFKIIVAIEILALFVIIYFAREGYIIFSS